MPTVTSKLFARRRSRQSRRWKPTFERLESRELLSTSWPEFGFNAQHTAESPVAAQDLQAIRWSTPVDLNQNGGAIHYGSPPMTAANRVIVPGQSGSTNGLT